MCSDSKGTTCLKSKTCMVHLGAPMMGLCHWKSLPLWKTGRKFVEWSITQRRSLLSDFHDIWYNTTKDFEARALLARAANNNSKRHGRGAGRNQRTTTAAIVSRYIETQRQNNLSTRKRAIAKALHLKGQTTSRQTFWVFRVGLVWKYCFRTSYVPLGATWPWKRPPLKLNK